MIRSTKELLAEVDKFADSHELADALEGIAESDEIDPNSPDAYYLNEAAIHINSMHDLLREIARALKAKDKDDLT